MSSCNIDKKGQYFDYKMRSEYDSITSKKCKCGHIITFHCKNPNNICRCCGRINFLNKKAEYDYMIKRRFSKCNH